MKIHKNCCHQSWSFWPRYAPNRLSAAGGFVPHSTRRAYSAPRSPSWFRAWPPGKGKEKREGKGREKEGRGIGRERRRGDERGSWTPQIFRWIDAFALLYFVSDDIMYHEKMHRWTCRVKMWARTGMWLKWWLAFSLLDISDVCTWQRAIFE